MSEKMTKILIYGLNILIVFGIDLYFGIAMLMTNPSPVKFKGAVTVFASGFHGVFVLLNLLLAGLFWFIRSQVGEEHQERRQKWSTATRACLFSAAIIALIAYPMCLLMGLRVQ